MIARLSSFAMCSALALATTLGAAQSSTRANTSQNPNADSQDNPETWSQPDTLRIVKEVRSKLAGLSNYDVFDELHFALKGHTVVLEGYASRPTLKSDAESAVKGISGVQSVENEIKVLPNSPNDDRIRMGVYRRIYGQASLRKYSGSPVGFGRFPSVAMAAGGITQDPPLGYHAIHIIVDNGHVILKGVVDSESDASIAAMQANMTPGAFSVENDLQIAGKQTRAAK